MTLKIKYLLFIVIIFTCCASSRDYEVIYKIREQNDNLSNSKLNIEFDSSAVLFFEHGFEKTKVNIKRNNLVIYENTISTEMDVLLADVKNLGAISENLNNTYVSINNGKYFKIELSKKYKYAGINYFRDTVLVEYLNYYPIYD